MKQFLYSALFFIGISTLSFSQEAVEKSAPPAGNATVGDFYGDDVSSVSVDKAISVEKLEGEFKDQKSIKNVAVKGMVTDVCEKRGCWVTIKTENGSSFFVKMKDYAFFVPTALKGKNVVLEGNAEKKITSVDELKHYAKDAKKSPAEINAITMPKEEIRFMASGIKVVN
ncbi:DUF4920 domain-containing protein [Flavobacterium zhairuonense]|uniref:DUF4920 domain-containing protein n=1 Tax=Flavobacterium zhairuonense TaxID=2493631 RepID=UPI001045A583|nr:DUF4920 domain-containing protein [Flavobacterium zhairuonense]KAF2508047.1 DUF4920 domain-containing protein [Flavobacterium zhairuonense]